MSANSNIEWTDHTFNPWMGCTKVAPACDHCYAERSTPARALSVGWGAGQARLRTSAANWALPVRWNAQAEAFHAQHGRRQRVFCASLADVFDNAVDPQWRLDLLDLIRKTPGLDWLLLTKRIGNVRRQLMECLALAQEQMSRMQSENGLANWLASWVDGEPPANVWLGATITSQAEADRDIPKLLDVPAAKRFLSMEPLLGAVDLSHLNKDCETNEINALKAWRWEEEVERWRDTDPDWIEQFEDWFGKHPDTASGPAHAVVDWVIVGGESGPEARPMHPDWARSLRDQCEAAGVPFLFKQWGEWAPDEAFVSLRDEMHEWGEGEVITGRSWRRGKKAAGRHLDGVLHDGYPAQGVTPC